MHGGSRRFAGDDVPESARDRRLANDGSGMDTVRIAAGGMVTIGTSARAFAGTAAGVGLGGPVAIGPGVSGAADTRRGEIRAVEDVGGWGTSDLDAATLTLAADAVAIATGELGKRRGRWGGGRSSGRVACGRRQREHEGCQWQGSLHTWRLTCRQCCW